MSTPQKPLIPLPMTSIEAPHAQASPSEDAQTVEGKTLVEPPGLRESGPVERSSGTVERGSGLVSRPLASAESVETFPQERPAAEHVSAARAEWQRRAEWLEAEAKAQSEPTARSRLLLAASEVRALLGARLEARRWADQAATLAASPGLAARQARSLAFTLNDVGAVLRSLQEEARAARLPATRAHAYYFNAELLRLLRRDDGESEQRLEAAEQSDPSDHRATLQRLVRQLANTQRPPDVRFRPDESLKALRQATGQLRQLRGSEAPRLGSRDLGAQPLLEAQRAVARARLSDAADALGPLEAQPGLSAAVHLLATLWRSLPKAGPEELLAAAERLAQRHPGRLELRAWAGRALASGSSHALAAALGTQEQQQTNAPAATEGAALSPASGTAPAAFSAADRAALAALLNQPSAATDPGGAAELQPLALARERLLNGIHAGAGPSESSRELALGAALLADGAQPVESLQKELRESPWTRALRLELSRRRGDRVELARELVNCIAGPNELPEGHFVAAVLAEQAGASAVSQEHYRAALAQTVREAALRALGPNVADSAALLRGASAQVEDGSRRALLLTEALLRMEPDAGEFDAVAEEAWRSDPELPWSGDLAEVGARMRGDRERVGRWLSRQRERAPEAADAPLCTLREARFLALSEPHAAVELMRSLERPDQADLALRQQIEALEPGLPQERAAFRARAAAQASPRGRERLLAEVSQLEQAQGNGAAAVAAARELASPLGKLRVEAWALEPDDLAWLSSEWSREIEHLSEPEAVTELLERLARLDRARGALDRALVWRQRLQEQPALSIGTLRFLQTESMMPGCEAELERSATRLAAQLGDGDALAQLFLATRLRIDRGAFADTASLAERAAALAAPPLWALRLSSAHARSSGDDRQQLAYQRELRERARQPLDVATLSLRAAEAAARLGELELATAELERALEIVPEHIVALALRAEILQSMGKYAEAADAFETVAATSQCQPRRVEALYRTALLCLDRLGDRERAIVALEEAAAVGLDHSGVQERLRALRPLLVPETVSPPRARAPGADGTLERARSLRNAGQLGQAGELVAQLLAMDPSLAEARHLQALLQLEAGDPDGAEQSWLQLEASPLPRSLRLAVLRALQALYEGQSGDAQRGLRVYREILLEDPDDDETRRRLISGLKQAIVQRAAAPDGMVPDSALTPDAALRQDAVLHQRELLLRAPGDDQRRQALLDLVPLLEHSQEGVREAETLLEQAHRTWPDHGEVLTAQVDHYRRRGNANTARVLLERAQHGARNAVLAGRLEPGLFQTLEQAALLNGDPEGSRLARATLAALEGQPLRLSGAGSQAGQQRLDDLIAPAPLSSAFRRLMYGAGAAIERAYAGDPQTLGLTPMPDAQAAQVRAVAAAFGLQDVRVAISDEVGCDCITTFGDPVCVVFGRALLAHDNPRVRDFLLLRSLKIAQVNACALSRMSPNELWSAVAGFLACFAAPWRAEGQDAQRLIAARNHIRPHVTATLSRELTVMTEALTSNVVPQAAQLGDALWRWAARVALLGVGDPGIALEGLAAAQARPALPRDFEGRIRWIAGSSSARDLVGYSISDAYTEARRRAGLAAPSR
ncbi:MAG: hypothetical protein RL685_4957 [Pseudomonadota bacterium]|jgi:Tfp pilus assembly protein PilF